VSDPRHTIDVKDLLDALRARQPQPESDGIVPKNSIHILVMGIVAAVGALIWSNATTQPARNAEIFGSIQQQTAEIRTTVLEMRGTLTGINERLENNTRQTADQQAKIAALESKAATNSDRIRRLEEESQRDR
jgi:hypothetical protein